MIDRNSEQAMFQYTQRFLANKLLLKLLDLEFSKYCLS